MLTYLHIRAINDATSRAILQVGHRTFPCVIGRHGRTHLKREGDGRSPIGCWRIGSGFFRSDRLRRLVDNRFLRPLQRSDGWCDDPASGRYNRPVKLPLNRSHESMWREDGAYDVVFPTDHNQCPRVKGAGSAIFLHLTRAGVNHTAGCVAVSSATMQKLLQRSNRNFCLVIWPSQGLLSAVHRKSHSRP
jgi:L,D-peptidoglycan transpeptidase YkuD (ErfK/YbiS/YcfS/YnhG family)